MKKPLFVALWTVLSFGLFAQNNQVYKMQKEFQNGYIEYTETYQTFDGGVRPPKKFQFYFSKDSTHAKVNLLNVTDSIRYIYTGTCFYTINYKTMTITADSSQYAANGYFNFQFPELYDPMLSFDKCKYQKKRSTAENMAFKEKTTIFWYSGNIGGITFGISTLFFSNESKSLVKFEYKDNKYRGDSVRVRTSMVEHADFNKEKYSKSTLYDIGEYNSKFTVNHLLSFQQKEEMLKELVYTAAPDFELPIVGSDSTLKLSDYKDKWVLLDFWFMRCKPCMVAYPKIDDLYRKYHAKGLEVIGLNVDANDSVLVNFVKEKKIPFPTLNTKREGVAKLYSVSGYPTFFLLNSEHKIVAVGHNADEMSEYVRKQLK